MGFKSLDGTAVKQALDSIKGFDINGLETITYNSPDDHGGSRKVAVYQVRGGDFVRVADFQDAPVLMPEK